MGEIVTKALSNASWKPGGYDFNAPWKISEIVVNFCISLQDKKLLKQFYLLFHRAWSFTIIDPNDRNKRKGFAVIEDEKGNAAYWVQLSLSQLNKFIIENKELDSN